MARRQADIHGHLQELTPSNAAGTSGAEHRDFHLVQDYLLPRHPSETYCEERLHVLHGTLPREVSPCLAGIHTGSASSVQYVSK